MLDGSPQPAKTSAADDATGRILVIDDDPGFRLMVAAALEGAGYQVDEAADGETGLQLFQQFDPDVVLLDIMMPGKDGFDVCLAIRSLPNGESAPVVMLTGLDDTESVARAFEVGATTFFTKPLNLLLIGHRLRYIIRARRTYERMRESEARLADAQRLANMGHWEWRRSTHMVTCSESLCDIIRLPPDEPNMTFDEFLDLIPKPDRSEVENKILRAIRQGSRVRLEHRLLANGGQERFIYQEAAIYRDTRGRVTRILGVAQDVSERKRNEEKIRYLAYFDPTTGLPNRALLKNLLGHAIEGATRNQRKPAVLFVDIDYFKRINDTYGHDVGDTLLREVADRLVRSLRIGDRVSRAGVGQSTDARRATDASNDAAVTRLGGDEFVIVLNEISTPESAASVARRIAGALAAPFRIGGRDTTITASIGIAVFPDDGNGVDELLRNADAAMYDAKAHGRNCFQFYSSALHEKSMRKFSLELDLRKALENDEFVLYYQPKVDLGLNSVTSVEALLRWQHPSGELVSPMEFVPIAEETGLIVPIGEWVLKTACAQVQAWRNAGFAELDVSVNLSAAQFRQLYLVKRIARILQESGFDPKNLVLELTESMLVDDVSLSSDVLNALKDFGVRIAIDDFGTGYSSLNYLRQLPISELKIDRSFVRNVPKDADDAAIVNATIALAHSLRLRTVAEGVETAEQFDFLRTMGCDEIQGFLISRPLPVDAFESWLRGSIYGEAA